MISNLSVVRSRAASALFLVSAAIMTGVLLWAHHLPKVGSFAGLTPIFFVLFTFFDYYAAMGLLLALIAAALLPARVSLHPLTRWAGEHPLAIALVSTATLTAGALLVYRSHPLAMDEYAQYFQSQVFAAGRLSGHFPPALLDWLIPHGFQDFFLAVSPATGQVVSAYWPSFALLLTPFTFLGIPWACNPVISGLTVLVIHRLALHLFEDIETAGLAVLLTVASPVFFGEGISYYSMPAHLLLNGVYALLLLRPTGGRAALAGFVGSIALTLHNPVPHILFALPWIVWLLRRSGGVRIVGLMLAGYLPLCLILGFGWFWFTGQIMNGGAHTVSAAALSLDFHRIAISFSLPSGTLLFARLIGIAKICAWAVPVLPVLAGVGAWKSRHNPFCRLLLASALLTLLGYLFVPVDQGHGWGYRYFHSAWLALPLLGASALARVPGTRTAASLFEDADTHTFVVACILATFIGGVAVRAAQMHEFMSDDLSQLPAYAGTERHIELIDATVAFYGADLVQNDPWLRGSTVRMLSQGAAANAAMMRKYFPTFHRVFADHHGWVWSSAAPSVAAAKP